MTTHAMTLPGIPPAGPPGCRGEGCDIVIDRTLKGDTLQAWHDTLELGANAMQAYLTAHSHPFQHAASCEFSVLPPSVHIKCRESYSDLKDELERARKAGLTK
jgi:predicted ATPase